MAVTQGYLNLPGSAGNYCSTPDHADFDITGDIDIRARVLLNDWTPGAASAIAAKYGNAGNRTFRFQVSTAGKLQLIVSPDGTALTTVESSLATGISDGAAAWVRVTWRASDGRVQFFTHADQHDPPSAGAYSQLGTDQTAAIGTLKNSSAVFEVGSIAAGSSLVMTGKLYYIQVYNGIDGTLAAGPDFGGTTGGSTYTDPQGHVWTKQGTASFVVTSSSGAGLLAVFPTSAAPGQANRIGAGAVQPLVALLTAGVRKWLATVTGHVIDPDDSVGEGLVAIALLEAVQGDHETWVPMTIEVPLDENGDIDVDLAIGPYEITERVHRRPVAYMTRVVGDTDLADLRS